MEGKICSHVVRHVDFSIDGKTPNLTTELKLISKCMDGSE